jgi:sphinganine-1-phosphate aldolase
LHLSDAGAKEAEMSAPIFPDRGVAWKSLEQSLLHLRASDPPWEKSFCFWSWPNPGRNVYVVAKDAQAMFYNQFWLGRHSQPSGVALIQDVKQMTREILGAPNDAIVSLTFGGTESNFAAILAARQWARETRSTVHRPNIVVPYSAHPTFNKAGFYLGIDIIRVPISTSYRADVSAMAEAINASTIMVAGSAPAYSHGQCDPIREIGALAAERGLWCHVDACVGGFLLPFLRVLKPDTPEFDFQVPGVRSIAADLHKFGYVPTGISSLTLRDASDYKYTVFEFSEWPRGQYRTDSFAGSRTSSIVAAAWTVLKHLGRDGYIRLARELLETSDRLRAGIGGIGDLRMAMEPEAGIFLFTSDSVDVQSIASVMTLKGFPTFCINEPRAIHLLLHPAEDFRDVDLYLTALAGAYDDVREGRGSISQVDSSYA